jgi:dTDP-4-dehydrorhamnose 3,5-epimerase
MDNLITIDGVLLTPLKQILSPLGNVYHGLKMSDPGFVAFQEAYFSTVNKNAIKPWKKHIKMTLNIIVPLGEIRFVLYDEREQSPTKGNFMDITLSLQNYHRLTIPPDVYMSFKGVGESSNMLLNIANIEHDPLEIVRKDIEQIHYQW